MRQLDAPEFCF